MDFHSITCSLSVLDVIRIGFFNNLNTERDRPRAAAALEAKQQQHHQLVQRRSTVSECVCVCIPESLSSNRNSCLDPEAPHTKTDPRTHAHTHPCRQWFLWEVTCPPVNPRDDGRSEPVLNTRVGLRQLQLRRRSMQAGQRGDKETAEWMRGCPTFSSSAQIQTQRRRAAAAAVLLCCC